MVHVFFQVICDLFLRLSNSRSSHTTISKDHNSLFRVRALHQPEVLLPNRKLIPLPRRNAADSKHRRKFCWENLLLLIANALARIFSRWRSYVLYCVLHVLHSTVISVQNRLKGEDQSVERVTVM